MGSPSVLRPRGAVPERLCPGCDLPVEDSRRKYHDEACRHRAERRKRRERELDAAPVPVVRVGPAPPEAPVFVTDVDGATVLVTGQRSDGYLAGAEGRLIPVFYETARALASRPR